MTELDEKLDSDIEKTIKTKCIKGHSFKVPKEKIQTSSTGKSFVTLCPKCNSVARLRKDEVYELFGINPRDHIAVGNLFSSLAVGVPPQAGQTSSTPPTANGDLPGTPVKPIKKGKPEPDEDEDEDDEDLGDDEDEDDEDLGDDGDEDEDDDEAEDDDEDEEYTAVVETAPDVTGKKKTVKRFRVLTDEDEPEDDSEEDYTRNRTPIKSSKKAGQPAKKARSKVARKGYEYEEDEMEDDEPPRGLRNRKPSRRAAPMLEEDVFDPNEILKDLIEESGLDESTLGRIFEYIDLQPDGWQPAAIQGVLQMYLSPASAQKLAQRYQAAIYVEEKKRDRERQMLSLVGTPSGNMRLLDNSLTMNFPPVNNPLRQGFPPGTFPPSSGFTPGIPTGYQSGGFSPDQYQPPYAPPRPPAPRGMSPYEVERIIDVKLNGLVEKLTKSMGESKRDDILAQEAKDMRMMMLELFKERMSPANQPTAPQQNPQVSQLMQSQTDLVSKLLTHTLEKKKEDDPMNSPLMKILLQEILSKKQTSAPPLASTSEELAQRIQLQRLANEIELAQADFKDKQEGRAFTRDLAGQALSKIGESVASAYIETQRIQAEAAKEIASRQASAPPGTVQSILSAPPAGVSATAAPPVATEPTELPGEQPGTHKVRGVPTEDGSVKLPCPTCGADMFAKIGDPQVKCGTCGTTYNAVVPGTTHVETESPQLPETPQEQYQTPSMAPQQEAPVVKPDEDKSSKYGFPVYENPPEDQSAEPEEKPKPNDAERDDWGGSPTKEQKAKTKKPAGKPSRKPPSGKSARKPKGL